MYASRARDRFTTPSFMQRDRFSRFQPTYPYIQHEIDLPPTISLSDGEEPPPYQGPCTLQLRDPEQQMELNRESVRAPPNRTIFDSDLIDISMYNGGPCPPSSNSGISATNYSSNGRMEGPPPTYSEVMGHYPGSSYFHHQQNNTSTSSQTNSRLTFPANDPESTVIPVNGKDRQPGNLVWILPTCTCSTVRQEVIMVISWLPQLKCPMRLSFKWYKLNQMHILLYAHSDTSQRKAYNWIEWYTCLFCYVHDFFQEESFLYYHISVI